MAWQLQRLRRRWDRYHLLLLDEFGYIPFSKAGAALLFDAVGRAYERQNIGTVLTRGLDMRLRAILPRSHYYGGVICSPNARYRLETLYRASQRSTKAVVTESIQNNVAGEDLSNPLMEIPQRLINISAGTGNPRANETCTMSRIAANRHEGDG